jgi:hypothetical protein
MLSGTDAAELHGDCLSPVDVPLRGVESLLRKQLASIRDDPFVDYADGYGWLPGREPRPLPPEVRTVYVRVRCRKCATCSAARRRLWTARAFSETRNAVRTWFGTLTVAPDRRFQAMCMADREATIRRAERLDAMSDIERTKLVAKQLAPEVTRWLKRVRKQSKASLRYLLVVEPHKDGFPHFHLLMHEVAITQATKRVLEGQWTYGFSKFKLIPPGEVRQVRYVCKYVAKSAQTRVRASRNYGQFQI